jgi:hypothetical protein
MQNRPDCFAVRFNGGLRIDTAGYYTFWDYSDAGSKLYIDNYCVTNNDGAHSLTLPATDSLFLSKGVYSVSLDYFQDSGSSGLVVYYKGPGITKKKIPKAVLFNDPNSAVRHPVPAQSPVTVPVRISHLQNNTVSISVAYTAAYEIRVLRADGRAVKTIYGRTAAIYKFTGQDLKPGVYFVTVVSNREKVLKTMVLY